MKPNLNKCRFKAVPLFRADFPEFRFQHNYLLSSQYGVYNRNGTKALVKERFCAGDIWKTNRPAGTGAVETHDS